MKKHVTIFIGKEFKKFFRNRFLPRVVIIFPLWFGYFSFVANMEIKNIRLLIVDHDKSVSSAIRSIKSTLRGILYE
jgi:hypothetical protein